MKRVYVMLAFLLTVSTVRPFRLMAQCTTIGQETCSCPGSPPIVISVCQGAGSEGYYSLVASCCGKGRNTVTCFDGGPCPFAKLIGRREVRQQLALLSSDHLVLIPDCKGSLHPVWHPDAVSQAQPPFELSIHEKIVLR